MRPDELWAQATATRAADHARALASRARATEERRRIAELCRRQRLTASRQQCAIVEMRVVRDDLRARCAG
jgi:hypothetical protein